VKCVIEDVLCGDLSPEPGAALPPTLHAYHEKLLQRCQVGDLHQLLTPLVALLALAREPLSTDEIAALLRRRGMLAASDDGESLVRRSLGAIGSMITLAPDPDGGDGYTLWHHSLRQHVLGSESLRHAVATAREAMLAAARNPGGDGAERYLYRQGLSHRLEAGDRDGVLAQMTAWDYVAARWAALGVETGPKGLAEDWIAWLVPSEDREALEREAQRFGACLGEMVEKVRVGEAEAIGQVWNFLAWTMEPLLRTRIGGVYALRPMLEQTLVLTECRASAAPEDRSCQRDLSVSYEKLGNLDVRTDPARARSWFEKSLAIAERLVALEPDNRGCLRDLSVSCNKLGNLDVRTDPARARSWFEKSLAIAECLAALEPDNLLYLRGLLVSYNRCGNLDEQTDPPRARNWIEKDLAIRERLVSLTRDPAEAYKLARVHAHLGAIDSALDALDLALSLGYVDFGAAATDDGLAPLRDDPRFLATLVAMHARAEAPEGA
jgi:tetratricopeptide (TPR) repeat protein